LRKAYPYEIYNEIPFYIPIGITGDSYDRYIQRIEEMRQSLKIIFYCLNNIFDGPIMIDDLKVTPSSRFDTR
jgi:NADH:ubiquinone oxidoreductase subunit D